MNRAPRASIALIGFMGSGKSAVGAELAKLSGLSFLDLDAAIEAREGRRIAEIVAAEGTERFRRIEAEILSRKLGTEPCVAALGGGAFLSRENRVSVAKSAVSVWLDVPLETIRARVGDGEGRPLWPVERAGQRELLERRKPSYFLADLRVAGAWPETRDWVAEVRDSLRRFGFFR